MEIHQIRYFLALSETLNFTRAAAECNVAQPSLTRAIKKLEQELGGDLFRRERARTHLTELGRHMLPIMQQTLNSVQNIKSLAEAFQHADRAPLCLALSHTINSSLFASYLSEIARALPGLEVRIFRGNAGEVAEQLKSGSAELSVTGPLGDDWERFDSWTLFNEPFSVLVPRDHPLSNQESVGVEDLVGEDVLPRQHCEQAAFFNKVFRQHAIEQSTKHLITSEGDLLALVEAGLGVALVPNYAPHPSTVQRITLKNADIRRDVVLSSVAGRQRSPAANTFMKFVRAADWTAKLAAAS